MKKLFVFISIFFWLLGCSEEVKPIPSFPEIGNPLDQEDIFKSTIEGATQFSDLIVTLENSIELYRISLGGELFSGWIKKSYENGKIGYLFHCQNGVQDGLHTSWYDNGKKMVERTWKAGLRDGPFKLWTDAGILESRGFNKENLRHGLFEEFYADGIKKSEVEYINGKIESFLKWKPDGTQCPDTLVTGGTGLVVHYKEDGTVDSNESYFKGDYDYGRSNDLNDSLLEVEEIFIDPIDLNSTLNSFPEIELPISE